MPLVIVGSLLVVFFLVRRVQAAQNEAALMPMVEEKAAAYGLDPALVKAIIKRESSWNPHAGGVLEPSYGLGGVTPYIGVTFGVIASEDAYAELWEPEKNVEAICRFLSYLLDKYDWETAIQMYNEGEPNYWDGYRVPGYLSAVEGFYEEYSTG